MTDPGAHAAARLLSCLEEQNLTVPDELTRHYMRRNGEECSDPLLVKVVSLAAERFLAEILYDTLQQHKLKSQSTKEKRVLLMEDLAEVLIPAGVNIRNPPYYVDTVSAKKDAK